MADNLVKKIVALLRSDATEKQVAAAIVLGEIGARDGDAVQALMSLLDSGLAPLQRAAAEALGRLAAKRALSSLLPLLAARDESVRAAAVGAVVRFGDQAVPAVRGRLATTGEPAERRALEEILGRLGGRDAFGALLAALERDDAEAARAATLAVRQGLKDADARARRGYLAQLEAFLALKKTQASPAAVAAALKIMGFLEDDKAVPRLLAYAVDRRRPPAVRQEAVIALRFAAAGKGAAGIADKLVAVAETAPAEVARAALLSLSGVELPAALGKRLGKLAAHAESERALLAIARLGAMKDAAVAALLSRILLETGERARAEAAATALGGRDGAADALAQALLDASEPERAQMLARLLRPQARRLSPRMARAVVAAASARLEDHGPAVEALLAVAREVDAGGLAAALRALAGKLRKAKKHERALAALRVLGRSADATPDDGYALASAELAHGRRDEAFAVLGQLLERGFDVAAALRTDRSLSLEDRYHVGFAFAERGHPLGEEVLTEVAETAGRTKISQMARAKLRSSGYREG